MKAPAFWQDKRLPLWGQSLRPFSWIYQTVSKAFQKTQIPAKASVPVICVGNLVMGGAGKTPVSAFIASHIKGSHILSRGYGRSSTAIFQVDSGKHSAHEVGDEPLLLSQVATVWVGSDRQDLAHLAVGQGAKILILDDGFQNQSLEKNLTFLVVDGTLGFGNEHVFPAGPLREPLEEGLEKADALIVMGKDTCQLLERFGPKKPIFQGHFEIDLDDHQDLLKKKVIAFSGIGYPEKFFKSLAHHGIVPVQTFSFSDHYNYQVKDLNRLLNQAQSLGAELITTEKDWWRLPATWRSRVAPICGKAVFKEPDKLIDFIKQRCCIK